MKKCCTFFCLFVMALGCNNENTTEKAISQIEIPRTWIRFDSLFANANPNQITELKADFPFLFPRQFSDSVWVFKLQDPIFQEVYTEIEKNKDSLLKLRNDIYHLLQHIKHEYPDARTPKIFTVISEVDYANRVFWADSLLLISSDTYLGDNHRFYQGIPGYIRKQLSADYLLPDIALAFAKTKVPPPTGHSFLDEMVYYGKLRYLMAVLLADAPQNFLLHYSTDEWNWAKENEAYIWMYFIEKELLYSTDPTLSRRFIADAPFSKFYLEIDAESPGRIGQYIGWRIVDSYMKNNSVSLKRLLQTDAQQLFEQSKFKPERP